MTINDLRKKTNDEKLSKKAKSLIKDWKNLLESKTSSSKSRKADIDRSLESKAQSSELLLSTNNGNGVGLKTPSSAATSSNVTKNPDEVYFAK